MILDERGFTGFVPWAARAKDLLAAYADPPAPTIEERWRDWGEALGMLPAFPAFPAPKMYDSWRLWVQALNLCVNPPSAVQFAWGLIPNLEKNGAFSVDIRATYCFPSTPDVAIALVGSLPTGWTFAGTTLSHSGAVLAGPNTIHFTATYKGATYLSNLFTVQGI